MSNDRDDRNALSDRIEYHVKAATFHGVTADYLSELLQSDDINTYRGLAMSRVAQELVEKGGVSMPVTVTPGLIEHLASKVQAELDLRRLRSRQVVMVDKPARKKSGPKPRNRG